MLKIIINKEVKGQVQQGSEMVMPVANNVTAQRLCSADNCCVERPRAKLKFGDGGFCAAAPEAWNSLPNHIKCAPTLSLLSEGLKTELFSRSNS